MRHGSRIEERCDAMSTVAGDSSSNSDTSSEADATSLSRAEMGGDATGTGSLRSHFSELDGMPCERIFLVRQVQKLALGSAEAVRAHFSAYGVFERCSSRTRQYCPDARATSGASDQPIWPLWSCQTPQ